MTAGLTLLLGPLAPRAPGFRPLAPRFWGAGRRPCLRRCLPRLRPLVVPPRGPPPWTGAFFSAGGASPRPLGLLPGGLRPATFFGPLHLLVVVLPCFTPLPSLLGHALALHSLRVGPFSRPIWPPLPFGGLHFRPFLPGGPAGPPLFATGWVGSALPVPPGPPLGFELGPRSAVGRGPARPLLAWPGPGFPPTLVLFPPVACLLLAALVWVWGAPAFFIAGPAPRPCGPDLFFLPMISWFSAWPRRLRLPGVAAGHSPHAEGPPSGAALAARLGSPPALARPLGGPVPSIFL